MPSAKVDLIRFDDVLMKPTSPSKRYMPRVVYIYTGHLGQNLPYVGAAVQSMRDTLSSAARSRCGNSSEGKTLDTNRYLGNDLMLVVSAVKAEP
ncbi:hypothetical protein JOB18_023595 [Solea senegalensis]|uniref:Uncharacterized protein n=1 Tax=Solea senegalensis TaxID=28829 RepID=A0AAV6QIN2_SOLSE|nr:hypothetical protein JOB18_023595 [Solea senegalensis]